MLGWKIVNVNYVDVMENVESSRVRRELLMGEMKKLGVEAADSSGFIEIRSNN